jgi:hypothetical protein
MQYQMNELHLTLPEVVQDRSVNVLLFGTKQPPDFNLVISREFLPKGEKFEYIVKKQLDVIAGSQKDFKLIGPERERTVAKEDGSTVGARETTVTYKSNGTKFVQRHLYIPLGGPRILILTGTVTSAWESPDDAMWDKLANSIRLK